MKISPSEKPPTGYVACPWGSFKQFNNNRDCTVSLITVLPGQRIGLQSHTGRSELWVMIDDGVVVQVGSKERVCRMGEEIWIPANVMHRLSCAGPEPVRVLELAYGDWQTNDVKQYADASPR